jgi:hypothetical protein
MKNPNTRSVQLTKVGRKMRFEADDEPGSMNCRLHANWFDAA